MRFRRRFIEAGFVGLLALYILAGCALVPFHGDESTIIYMSRDYDTLFRRGDLAHILYRDPLPANDPTDPQAATLQDLRLINGVLNKYLYGLTWSAAGLSAADLNDQWLWGADLAFNRANGHIPGDALLFMCRLASGWLTVLSAAVVYVIGKRAGGWRTGALAALIYTLMPAVLLNGRRAMMESGLLLCGALLIYVAGRAARGQPNTLRPAFVIGMGLLGGLVVASKHTGALTVAAAFGAMALWVLLTQHAQIAPVIGKLMAAGGLALIVFLALNAAWWSDPLSMPRRILTARSALLNGQVSAFGGFGSPADRLTALIREPLGAPPQYYEVAQGWPDWIGDQITRYQASGLAGVYGNPAALIIGGLLIVGAFRAAPRWQDGTVFVIGGWAISTLITVYLLTPLDWQRYYLPLAQPVALLCGLAVMRIRSGSL